MYYKKIKAIMDAAGVRPSISLVGAAIIRDGWACDHWRLTLKGRTTETFDYHTGVDLREGGEPSTPALLDIIYSLACDERAVDADFENWCSDYGYDSGSVKACRMHEECVATGLRFRRVFGHGVIGKIREVLEEY